MLRCCISNGSRKVCRILVSVFLSCFLLFSFIQESDKRNKLYVAGFLPLILLHDGGALVVLNLGVRVDTDNQVVTHSLGLTESVEVT